MLRLAILLNLILFSCLPLAANALPVVLLAAQYIITDAIVLAIVEVAIVVGSVIYGAAQQRKAARAAEQAKKDEYNSGLHDRTVTSVSSESPLVYIYGRARVGSNIVAIMPSGDKDQYKHLVCVLAAHECDGIEEIYIAGKAIGLGGVDVSGNVTSGVYFQNSTKNKIESINSTSPFVLTAKAIVGSVQVVNNNPTNSGQTGVASSYDNTANTVTISGATSGTASYQFAVGDPRVRVQIHLGTATDTADASLLSDVPALWTTNAVLRGFCYIVVRLDLNQPEFQTGIPSIEAVVRGKKTYDPRTTTTAWNQNPALAINDYLTSPLCNIPASDIPQSQLIAAANVCDVHVGFDIIGTPSMGGIRSTLSNAQYTLNGTVTSAMDQANTLSKMAEAMAGTIVATTWQITAGSYVAPVAALAQSDIVGNVSLTPGLSGADLFNGAKGQYVSPTNNYVLTDYTPYQNSAYVAGDGKELWTTLDFPFTDQPERVRQLCRIRTEDVRNSYTFKADFSLKAWPYQVGDRITLDAAFFGMSAKIFRITDKRFSPAGAVELTLKEDASSIWDRADATQLVSTPPSTLKNPYSITTLTSITCSSGANQLLVMGDGTIVSQVLVQWSQPTTQAVVTTGEIEVQWQKVGDSTWLSQSIPGSELQTYISPVADGAYYVIRARCINPYFNVKSDWVYNTHKVLGKLAPPPSVTNFRVIIKADGTRQYNFDVANQPVDVTVGGGYDLRYRVSGSGLAWAAFTPLTTGTVTQSPYESNNPLPGVYDFGIAAVNSSGVESAAATLVSTVVVGSGDYTDSTRTTGTVAATFGNSLQALNALIAANKAESALASAQAALVELTNIASDGIMSANEKPTVVLDYNTILSEQSGIQISATNYGVAQATYNTAVTALTTYLNSLSPAYTLLTVDTVVDGPTFRQKFIDVYTARQILENAIATSAKAIGDAAQLTATNAATAAIAAQNTANTANAGQISANAELANIASDNVLSSGEKPRVILDYNAIIAEQSGIDSQAVTFSQSSVVYDTAITALTSYLTSLSPAYNTVASDTIIVGTTFRTKFGDVYLARQNLLNAIAAKAKTLADAAQSTASGAVTAAGNAQGAANLANAELANIANDNILSSGEKPRVILDYNAISAEQAGIDAQASSLSVSSAAYDTAVAALTTYLGTLSPAYSTVSSDTVIVGTTFRSQFGNVYAARQNLLNAIAAKAATLANWTGVTGTGRPADNATVGANAYNFNATVGGDNLVGNSDFSNRSSFRPLGFTAYNNAAIAVTYLDTPGRVFGKSFSLQANAGTTSSFGLYTGINAVDAGFGGVQGGWKPNTTYTIAFQAKIVNGASMGTMGLGWNISPTTVNWTSLPALSTVFQRYVVHITWGASVETQGNLYLSCTGPVVTNDQIQFSELIVQEGDVGSTWHPSIREAATLASWVGVTGTGRPADNATVGAQFGVNISGSITTGTAGTFIDPLAIGTTQLGNNSATSVVITSFADTLNSTAAFTGSFRHDNTSSQVESLIYSVSGQIRNMRYAFANPFPVTVNYYIALTESRISDNATINTNTILIKSFPVTATGSDSSVIVQEFISCGVGNYISAVINITQPGASYSYGGSVAVSAGGTPTTDFKGIQMRTEVVKK